MTDEQKIINCFKEMGVELARRDRFTVNTWEALSQYGYCLMDNFKTEQEARQFTLDYYKQRMNLINQ